MARDQQLIEERNRRIQERFEAMRDIRTSGSRKYTREYCLLRIAQEFYLSQRTVERIIYSS